MILNPSFWAGKRVLLTGHTGFKGSWLTLWLLKLGAQVWGYSLPPEGERSLFGELSLVDCHLNHHIGDLLDLTELKHVVQQAQPEACPQRFLRDSRRYRGSSPNDRSPWL